MSQQPNISAALQRVQRTASQYAPLVTDVEEAEWERQRKELLAIVAALVTALVEGRITVAEWEAAMRQRILQSHTLAYAITRGGLPLLTAEDVRRIEARVAGQFDFLKAWAAAMAVSVGAAVVATVAGKPASEAVLQTRAGMYIDSAGAELSAGKVAALGMPDLPAYPKDGQTRCRKNCYCAWRIDYLGGSDWDCYWRYDPTQDNCEQCPRRSLAWAPIRIRQGVIQSYIRTGLFI